MVTLIENPISSPALTGDASAVFSIEIVAQSTVVVADDDWTFAWFVAPAVAVFGYAPQLNDDVWLITCTCRLASAPGLRTHTRACSATIEQPGSDPAATLQLTPVPLGRRSEIVTLRAIPGPAFETVIEKPIWSPADTVAASAVFVTLSAGSAP